MPLLKAALHNIYILTTDQVTKCNMKGDSCGDKPTENNHLLY